MNAVFPPPATLTSHQEPALVVASLCAAASDGSSGQTLLAPTVRDLLQISEGCAQSIAVLMGYCARQQGGGGQARGMLVGLKGVELQRCPTDADLPLQVRVERILDMPPFAVYSAQVSAADGGQVAVAEVKTMSLPATESVP